MTNRFWLQGLIGIAVILAWQPVAVRAAIYYVDVSWTNSPGGGTAANPYDNIGDAVTAANASDGHSIYVADGTYLSTNMPGGRERYSTNGHSIIQGTKLYGGYAGWDGVSAFNWTMRVPRSSVLDLTNANTRALYYGVGDRAPLIDGFTFCNANHGGRGGAVCRDTSATAHDGITISDCLFTNNTTSANGGALYVSVAWNYSGIISNCVFAGNRGATGGGVFAVRANMSGANTLYVYDSTFSDNVATNSGGGLFLTFGSYGGVADMHRCSFLRNQALAASSHGGGLYVVRGNDNSTTLRIYRSSFVGNSATNGGAISGRDPSGGNDRSTPVLMENCLVYSNRATSYVIYIGSGSVTDPYRLDMSHCTVADNTGGGMYAKLNSWRGYQGSMRIRDCVITRNGAYGINYDSSGTTTNSELIYNDVWGHTTANYTGQAVPGAGTITNDPAFQAALNYHLQWQSPCVDSGTNLGVTVDLDSVARPQNVFYDMGCYEAVPPATILTLPVANVLAGSADLMGQLSATNATPTSVSVLWGTRDAATGSGWAQTNDFGPAALGSLGTNVGLAADAVYYYRYLASNDLGRVWSTNGAVFMTSAVWIEKTADAAEQGLVPGTFTLHRASSATNAAVTIPLALGGSATAGVHYVSFGSNVTFAAGESNATIVVTPINNTSAQDDTVLTVDLASGPYVIGAPASASLTVANATPQTLALSATDSVADEENQGPGEFTITRAGNVDDPVTVNYTVGGSANAADYVAVPPLSGAVIFAAGQTTTNIVLTPVLDWYDEGNAETVTVTLANGSYDIGSPSNGQVVIADYNYATPLSALYVDVAWTNQNGLGTPSNPCVTLTRAVRANNQVTGARTIYLADGVYRSVLAGGLEDFGTNGIEILRPQYAGQVTLVAGYAGWDGAAAFDWSTRAIRSTIFDLTNAGTRAIYRGGTSDLEWGFSLDGFTFRNANHTKPGGAVGSSVVPHTGLTLRNCLFTNNTTTADGGGAHLYVQWNVDGIVSNCAFVNNRGANGGGLYFIRDNLATAQAYIHDSEFVANTANGDGGGVFIDFMHIGQDLAMERCRFVGNAATGGSRYGGALRLAGSTDLPQNLIAKRCVFSGNLATNGSVVFAGSLGGRAVGTVWENCLVYANTAATYTIHTSAESMGGTYRIDMRQCTVADNVGGGIYGQVNAHNPHGSMRIRNSIIVRNGAYGIHYDTNGQAVAAAVLDYNDVWGHTVSNYFDDAFPGIGVLSRDPAFRNAAAGDYHPVYSLCANAGTDLGVTNDLDGLTRTRFDMGCYIAIPFPRGALFIAR